MIAHLRGAVLEKHPNLVIVETGGVGYEVHIPVSTFTRLPDVGGEAKLRIHMHVREDAMLPLLERQARRTASARELADACDTVIVSLPTLEIFRRALSGPVRAV